MKKLDAEREREIRQLLFVAHHYLSLAEPLNHDHRKPEDTKDAFMPGAITSENAKQLARLDAHLSSAATRLATVDEVLSRAGAPRSGYSYCVRYYSKKKLSPNLPPPSLSEWLHEMRRNNVGHREPPDGSPDLARRREERQALLMKLSFADSYMTLASIAKTLQVHLEKKHGVTFVV